MWAEKINEKTVLREVFDSHASTKKWFCGENSILRPFVLEFASRFSHLANVFGTMSEDAISRNYNYPSWYSFNALNSILVSTNLLVSGLLIQSGFTLRYFTECLAWALILSSKKLGYGEKIHADPKKYKNYHKSVDILRKSEVRKEIGLSDENKELSRLVRFYNRYSHATIFSTYAVASHSEKIAYLGSFFDLSKTRIYKIELIRRIEACELTLNCLEKFILPNLDRW
jgi:hypothetical protein